MAREDRAALQEVAERLEKLEREARAAGLHMLALRLERARQEAEKRLAEEDEPPAIN